MKSVNTVFLLGYLGMNPQSNKTTNGHSVANFSVACDESYKTEKGDLVEKVEWINCSAFGSVADIILKYVHKGDRVHIQGKIKTDTFEKNGERKYFTKVKVENIVMLPGKKKESDEATLAEVPESVVRKEDLPF